MSFTPIHNWYSHAETILAHLLRTLKLVWRDKGQLFYYQGLEDDIPYRVWSPKKPNQELIILSHGLEGSSLSPYIIEMANQLVHVGYTVWAWDMKGCSIHMNKGEKLYHSGYTNDLKELIELASTHPFKHIHLVGFSVGGNITLKLLGENNTIHTHISKAICFSVPLHLGSVAQHLDTSYYGFYMKRFLKSLINKCILKAKQHPSPVLLLADYAHLSNFKQFDEHITAPMHNFLSANDYYEKNASLAYLQNIITPTRVVNAMNDPFLTSLCYPHLPQNSSIEFDYPVYGGHCGFYWHGKTMLKYTLEFIR
jgi:predicted alpha/beta-fold hydrolase